MKKQIVKKKTTPVNKPKAAKKAVEKEVKKEVVIPQEQKVVTNEEQVREVHGIAEQNDPTKHHTLRDKYPDLSDEELAGTNEDVAARLSSKIGVPYSEIYNLLIT